MKNTDFEIQFVLRSGWTQTWYRRQGRGNKCWVQVTNGVERACTAEQVLNHLLPGMILESTGKLKIRVVTHVIPKWAQELTVDACEYLGIEAPQITWRHRRGKKNSSGRTWFSGLLGGRVTVNAGTLRTDAKMVLLHELVHIKTQGDHTSEFWDECWRIYRWAKLPMRYCLKREAAYRKGSVPAYHRIKKEIYAKSGGSLERGKNLR